MPKNTILLFLLGWALANQLYAQHPHDCPSCQHLKQEIRNAYLDWGGHKSLNINYNDRSDTIDILHYSINLSMPNVASGSITANCVIDFSPKMNNISQITLDLLQLTVDSIKMGNNLLTYTHNDTIIYANFPTNLNIGDSSSIQVFYRGQPQEDAMWGGFYVQGGYAFNLGVGFAANPHNYGRVWYPCFDNFVERATYSFQVSTDSTVAAFCNGSLSNENIVGTTRTRTWEMTTPIPTYLSCVAIADYEVVHQNYSGLTGLVPIELVAKAADTTNMKSSFTHLNDAMATYEYWFGPYIWNKVGYSAVPFNSGAMEHATNIAYPVITLNGSLTYETLMAHELSHHWWGDLATCETAEDMWINEGMATYCEHLFLEWVYGRERYIEEVKDNHYNVLQTAHISEGGYRPISGVPHQYTYGDHVYKKGAAMAHNLRWYLGDSLFRMGMTEVLDSFALDDLSSTEMRDYLTQVTGVDMTDFFNDWVFNGGFSHFEVDSMTVNPNGGNFDIDIAIQQKLKGAPAFHNNTPLQFTFYDDQWNWESRRALVSGEFDQVSFSGLSFEPKMVILNKDHHLNQARMDQERLIDTTGTFSFSDPKLVSFNVNAIQDSAYVHVAYHPVAADSIFDNPYGYQISSNRYWSVRGIWGTDFDAEFRIEPSNFIDSDLMANSGADSLILLYREHPQDPWREHPDYSKQQIASLLFMRVQTILPGDYVLANGQMGLGVDALERLALKSSTVYPNPADSQLTVDLRLRRRQELTLECYDLNAQKLEEKYIHCSMGKSTHQFSLGNWPTGIYFLKIRDHKGNVLASHKFVKK